MEKEKKSFFDKLPPSFIKNDKVSIFPEGALGYLVGPTLALLANSILANYFNKYMSDVLHVNTWASAFFTWLPVISVIFVVIGNILVGRLMDNNTSRAGKARPLLLVSVPISLLALLFLFVFSPYSSTGTEWHTGALVCIAIGYNLWFAFAYPMYYTPHAALVNLSTRNSGDRSLLATISNATALAAMGLSSMILPFFLDLLFVYQTTNLPEGAVAQDGGKYYTLDGVTLYDAQASYDHWKIFVIALIIITFIGALIEYFFTRERVTEEGGEGEKKAALPIGEQAKICFGDKFWIIMMIFFFLYQFGGMIKNVSQNYFCTSMFADASGNYTVAYGGTLQGTLSIIGAIPTAIGMVVALPLANKIGKGKAILCGAVLATAGGVLGMLFPQNFIIVVVSFVIKALGSTPAMYLSLALLADILDHQEALHGSRTDGLSMTIYGAIMAGMTGLTTGVLNAVLSGVNYDVATLNTNEALRAAMPWLFIGGETLCYLVIFITFIFMKVERYSDLDHKAIVQDQAAQAKKEGRAFEMPKDDKPVAIDAALLKEYNELRKQNGRTEVKI
ncbi:MAG: MFS transporter [Oscillospiraceae bacterium]|nr:MFS transporter [Oscillospiraceae bacterium]